MQPFSRTIEIANRAVRNGSPARMMAAEVPEWILLHFMATEGFAQRHNDE